jgi:hypothetical protein
MLVIPEADFSYFETVVYETYITHKETIRSEWIE